MNVSILLSCFKIIDFVKILEVNEPYSSSYSSPSLQPITKCRNEKGQPNHRESLIEASTEGSSESLIFFYGHDQIIAIFVFFCRIYVLFSHL